MEDIRIDVGVYTTFTVDLSNIDIIKATNSDDSAIIQAIILSIKNSLNDNIIITRTFTYVSGAKFSVTITPQESRLIKEGAIYDFVALIKSSEEATTSNVYKISENGRIILRQGVGNGINTEDGSSSDTGISVAQISSVLSGYIKESDLVDKTKGKLSYSDLINTPNLSKVAISNNYEDLSNTPDLNQFATKPDDIEDVYITMSQADKRYVIASSTTVDYIDRGELETELNNFKNDLALGTTYTSYKYIGEQYYNTGEIDSLLGAKQNTITDNTLNDGLIMLNGQISLNLGKGLKIVNGKLCVDLDSLESADVTG